MSDVFIQTPLKIPFWLSILKQMPLSLSFISNFRAALAGFSLLSLELRGKKKLQWFYLFSLSPEDVLPTLPHLQNRTEKCRSSVVWWAEIWKQQHFTTLAFSFPQTRISSATNILPRAPNPRSAHSVSLSLANYYAPMRMFLAEL